MSLVAATVAAGLDVTATTEPAGLTVDDVATVLAYDASEGGALRAGLEALATSAPPEVRAAVERMLTSSPVGADWRLSCLERVLAAAGDVRDRAVFEHLVLGPGPWVERGVVAASIGVGQERLRQLRLRASERVDAAAGHSPLEVRELPTAVAGEVGSAAPRTAIDHALASLGLPGLCDPRSRLLVRMAGPYRHVDGHPDWVAVDPAELVAETRRMLREDGGVRLAEHVAKELRTLGMADEHVAAWLARQPVRIVDGLVVAMTGTPADVAERALHARGRPMSLDELAAWLPGEFADVETLWSARDRRFLVGDDDALALAEWADTSTGALELSRSADGHAARDGRRCRPRRRHRSCAADDRSRAWAATRVSTDVPHPLRAGYRGRRRPGCDPRIAAPGRARRRRGDRGRADHRALR